MAAKTGITPPIYKIDADAANEFFGGAFSAKDLPAKLIDRYNKDKGIETYAIEGTAEIDGCSLQLYRNVKTRPSTSSWVKFFDGSGIELEEIQNQMQHLVCFVVVDDELYAYTAGQSSVSFERFIDISFPIEVGRRVAKAEIKGAKSSQITGSTLASDVHFRDPRRITYAESLDNVWMALSGQLQNSVLVEKALKDVFGAKSKIRLDVTSAIRLGPRIESPQKLIDLIRWMAAKADEALPDDDPWAGLDAIKVLNPRKKKDLIEKLRKNLADRIFVKRDWSNITVAHIDASLYDNATFYAVSQGDAVLYEEDTQPELSDIVGSMTVDTVNLLSNFSSVIIQTENADYFDGVSTTGPLISHLHGEIRHGGKTYFLLAGKWYEVDATYIEQITKDFLETLTSIDLDAAAVGLRDWKHASSEGEYNETASTARVFINGDKVLTDNIELFDGLVSDGTTTYIVHVKRNFDVKVRDVRSQVINSAQIIENDLRVGTMAKLRQHHERLVRRKRTSLSEDDFLKLFENPRVYVVAYGSDIKVDASTIKRFGSSVARMEVVSLNNQFRQISSAESQAKLRVSWVKIVK
ncbi:DUF6119 family protein [Arthrobacter sp. KNU40]|uniref:DUF6119 family protein n=1 Tax=Arthrobacter sp. KNU40 TaxID=3447965 RepID=UPI003F5D8678